MKAQGYTDRHSLGKQRTISRPTPGTHDRAGQRRQGDVPGNPVVNVKALAAKGITVHAVGFIVDTAARGQLQAIAQRPAEPISTRRSGPEGAPDALKTALNVCAQRVATLPPKPKPGKLRTTSATWLT